MSLCPADGKPCCDDLCHGGGCMQMGGYQMLEVCHWCKGTIDSELPECSTCTCGDDEYPDEYPDDGAGTTSASDADHRAESA